MPPINMLAVDLDGTLAVDNHQVLPATRAGLKNLHETGVEVVIAQRGSLLTISASMFMRSAMVGRW